MNTTVKIFTDSNLVTLENTINAFLGGTADACVGMVITSILDVATIKYSVVLRMEKV